MKKNFKKTWPAMLMAAMLLVSIVSCKPKVSDADLKAKVETVTTSHPNVVVSVKEGVVTLSGTVASEDAKTSLADAVKNADAKNVKSVVNELTVEAAPIETNANDVDLITKVVDATKDFPTIKADVKDGVITVTGELEQARVKTLKQGLDALHPKKVDMSGLTVK